MKSAPPETQPRRQFELRVASKIAAADVEAWAREARAEAAPGVRMALAAAFAQVAFVAPERIAELYDAASAGWFGEAVQGPAVETGAGPITPPSADFWTQYWGLVDATSGLDSGDATVRTAMLSGLLDPALQPRIATACLAYPGVALAAQAGLPARIALADLAACPIGSLGEAFYRLIVDNNFDLEVLDRDALGLANLIPPLDYLNTRMLQTHDLWHIVAGYRTTKLHEVAISAFQMAQFGHGYSAVFLALIATTAALGPPAFFAMLMNTILSGWVHGRRTPSMLLIPWEQVWVETTEQIRARYDVRPYVSPYPADVFEQHETSQTRLAV
jgi:ubiquinone biosynthesis protein Coq4